MFLKHTLVLLRLIVNQVEAADPATPVLTDIGCPSRSQMRQEHAKRHRRGHRSRETGSTALCTGSHARRKHLIDIAVHLREREINSLAPDRDTLDTTRTEPSNPLVRGVFKVYVSSAADDVALRWFCANFRGNAEQTVDGPQTLWPCTDMA